MEFCNVARSRHWFRQVTVPSNVACGREFIKWQHPAMWYVALGSWHAIEFARCQHPAMWHVALGSWHWIRQVAAPCNVTDSSGTTCRWIRPNVPLYWNFTSGFDFDHITTVNMSFCTSLRNFIQIGPPSAEKNDVMSIFKMADLSHIGF